MTPQREIVPAWNSAGYAALNAEQAHIKARLQELFRELTPVGHAVNRTKKHTDAGRIARAIETDLCAERLSLQIREGEIKQTQLLSQLTWDLDHALDHANRDGLLWRIENLTNGYSPQTESWEEWNARVQPLREPILAWGRAAEDLCPPHFSAKVREGIGESVVSALSFTGNRTLFVDLVVELTTRHQVTLDKEAREARLEAEARLVRFAELQPFDTFVCRSNKEWGGNRMYFNAEGWASDGLCAFLLSEQSSKSAVKLAEKASDKTQMNAEVFAGLLANLLIAGDAVFVGWRDDTSGSWSKVPRAYFDTPVGYVSVNARLLRILLRVAAWDRYSVGLTDQDGNDVPVILLYKADTLVACIMPLMGEVIEKPKAEV